MTMTLNTFTQQSLSLWDSHSQIMLIKITSTGDIIAHNMAFTSQFKAYSNLFELVTLTHIGAFKQNVQQCLLSDSPLSFITNFSPDKNDVTDIPYSYLITMERLDSMIQLIAEPKSNLSHEDVKAYFSMVNDFSNMTRKIQKSEFRLKKTNDKLNEKIEKVEYLANHDMLTDMFNRRRIFEQLNTEAERFLRTGDTFCILIADIDLFKKINDSYGHLNGDLVLQRFAVTLKENIRPYDFVGRFGGEEFIVIFPNTKTETALSVANRLLQAVIKSPINIEGYTSLSISFSGGIAQMTHNMTIEKLIEIADNRLYHAKKHGRQQIIVNDIS